MLHPYWITDINAVTIGISYRPGGGEDLRKDLEKHKGTRPLLVVSLLEIEEAKILGLEHEKEVCEAVGINYFSFPIKDGSIPGYAKFVENIEQLYGMTKKEGRLLIHCHHGKGRSSLIALGLMVKHGLPLEESKEKVSSIRGFPVPSTKSQWKLLKHYAQNG